MDALSRSDDILPTSYEPNSFVLHLKKSFDINNTELKVVINTNIIFRSFNVELNCDWISF